MTESFRKRMDDALEARYVGKAALDATVRELESEALQEKCKFEQLLADTDFQVWLRTQYEASKVKP